MISDEISSVQPYWNIFIFLIIEVLENGVTIQPINTLDQNPESTDTIVDNIELPTNAVQCPITYPFPRYRVATTVEACCKCGDQSKCILVTDITDRTGINSYNIGGVNAMLAADGAVDECKSKYVKDHKINILLV